MESPIQSKTSSDMGDLVKWILINQKEMKQEEKVYSCIILTVILSYYNNQ